MSIRVDALTVDCADPHRLAGFWSALLGVAVKEVGADYAELASIGAEGPSLLFLQVPEAKAGKNRLHLDLEVGDVAAAVEEALTLGATRAEGAASGDTKSAGPSIVTSA